MELLDAIKGRRSIRKYKQHEITNEQIERLIDAARHSPSSADSQPWEFLIVKNQETKNKIAATREEDNQLEREAPVLIVVCVDTNRSKTRFAEDGNIAAQNIMLAAHELGLSATYLTASKATFVNETEKAIKESTNLPEHIKPTCVLAIGVPEGEPEAKALRDVKDLIHQEKW